MKIKIIILMYMVDYIIGMRLIDFKKIASKGWYILTDSEWKEMEMYFGMS